ncbi:hypothetical protein REPUB_Repub07fG0144600 [Reevesia pubescens]
MIIARMSLIVRSFLISTLFIGLLVEEHLTLGSNLLVGEVNGKRCRENERQALLIFKKSLVDDSGILSSWGNGDDKRDCCKWSGVVCGNRTGHVLMLNLQPTDGYLGAWKPFQLDLHGNDLYSDRNLEWLSHLSSLKTLDLSLSNLSMANDWVQVVNKLPLLESLSLQSCNLPNIISPSLSLINSSTSLTSLELSGNNLTSYVIYPWLLNDSSNLVYIDLSLNRLKGSVPEAFGNMNALKQLSLFNNQLEEHSLEILVLDNNQITGSIPDQIARFSSLTDLSLGNNRLNGTISESIANLSKLQILDLHGNFLKGVIFETHFSNLSNLQTLDFSYNSLSMEFSNNWIPPFQPSFIRLGSCKSGPGFPKWIQSQKKFAELDISDAGISDSIPLWFWDLSPSLRFLNLSYNQIGGILPDLSLKFVGFPGFDLRSNLLEGPLPLFPSKLTSLNLSKNRFSGSISSLCRITGGALQLLDLSENFLSGIVPNCFQQWPDLQVLNLANNNFSGRIPSSIGSPVSLAMFNLHNNSLSGELPSSLNNCTGLKFMDLSDNRLSGEIPTWIGQSLTSLQNYVYGDPQFGDIGPYIDKALLVWKGREFEYTKNLGLLIVIDLSSNALSGEIPGKVASLSGLVALNLSRNILTGVIPEKIGQLRQLEALDLSRNRLSGEIPTSMAEMTFLSHLDLSYNNLSGKIPLSTQLQNFDASAFSNNLALCGPPVSTSCSAAETPQRQPRNITQEDEDEFRNWFLAGTGVGFAVSLWGLCGALLLKHSWRHSYFHFLDKLMDWLNVSFGAQKARSKRKNPSQEIPNTFSIL